MPHPPEKGKPVNVLCDEKRLRVLAALLDGNSERAIERMTDVNARTIAKLVERLNATTRHMLGRLRRLCYAFSKKAENHRAAVALHYVAYNLCHVVKTLRVTPAMQANVTDHIWTTEELLHALLAATDEPGEAPKAKPLENREPEGPARQTPTGKLLRLVVNPTPALRRPHPAPPPGAAPVAPAPPRQLSLFDDPPPPKDQA